MFELNVYNLVLIPVMLLMSYLVHLRLRQPPEYRNISSHVPSATKSVWDEILFSLDLSMKSPKGIMPHFMSLLKTYGPVVHFNLTGRSYVLLNDPDDIKILFSSAQHSTKGPEYQMLRPWLNEGLLLSSDSKWQTRRKLLTNTFHFKTLELYNPSINKHARVLANKLLEASSDDKEVSIMEYMTLCSLDIICETIMGTEMNAQDGKSVEYVNAIKRACSSVMDRIFQFWLWNDVIFRLSKNGRSFYKAINVLHEFTDNVIQSKRAILRNTNNQKDQSEMKPQKKSFLDLLFQISEEHPDLMTDKDIREEVDTFLFEGHDTTSISMTMTLLLLGIYQDIQEKAREELQCIFGDSNRDATIEDLNSMTYLEAVIKESLRLYPSVPGVTRQLKTSIQLKNYNIPKSTIFAVYPFILHRNEDIYPKPEEFIPERFLEEDNKTSFLFGYLPFSAGPRNCIGQKYAMNQMKTVISTVLRKAKIDTLGTKEDIHVYQSLIIRIESVPKVKIYQIQY